MSTDAKIVKMTIGERIKALEIFNAFKGSIVTMRALLDDVKELVVSEEEWKAANLTKTPSDEEVAHLPEDEKAKINQTWKWDETVLKDISLQAESVDYLKAQIKAKSDAGDITINDVALSTLEAKL